MRPESHGESENESELACTDNRNLHGWMPLSFSAGFAGLSLAPKIVPPELCSTRRPFLYLHHQLTIRSCFSNRVHRVLQVPPHVAPLPFEIPTGKRFSPLWDGMIPSSPGPTPLVAPYCGLINSRMNRECPPNQGQERGNLLIGS